MQYVKNIPYSEFQSPSFTGAINLPAYFHAYRVLTCFPNQAARVTVSLHPWMHNVLASAEVKGGCK